MTNEARDSARQAMNDRTGDADKTADQDAGDSRVLAFNSNATGGHAQTTLDGLIAAAIPGPFVAVDPEAIILRFNPHDVLGLYHL